MEAVSAAAGEGDDVPPTPLWQAAGAECTLCGARRREHLFVIGTSRMSRCHGCGLISLTGSQPRSAPQSYRLDADAARAVLVQLPAGRILQIVNGPNAVAGDAAHEMVTVDLNGGAASLDGLEPHSFDGALVHGSLENVGNPAALLRRVRATLKQDGVVLATAGVVDLARTRLEDLATHSFNPATLLRLSQVAGLRAEACGLLRRELTTPLLDPRLRTAPRLGLLNRLASKLLGRPVEVSSGILLLRASASEVRARPLLSIVMPVFNEARTFLETFERVYEASVEGIDRELILVESNSTDGSRELVRSVESRPGVRVIYEEKPSGKGHAVRAALLAARGDILLIQDADSEYDVADYDIVLQPLLLFSATFVLGSRHMGGRSWKIRQFANARLLAWVMNLAHQGFTALANALYQADMQDPTTMYKVFRREAAQGIRFQRDRFDFDWELVCKLIRNGHEPVEVPINYRSRSYSEGKKVRFFHDPLTWLRTIVASRFEPLS